MKLKMFFVLFLSFISCINQVNENQEAKKSNTSSKVDLNDEFIDTIDINLFNEFVSKFKAVDLPITMNEDFLSSSLSNKRDKIENEYFQFLPGLFTDFNGENPYDYYTVMKFSISNSKIGLIIKENGWAGGVEDQYLLFIYTNNGKLLSREIISEYTGDCSTLNITTCVISKQLEVFLHSKEYYGECLGNDSLDLIKEHSKMFIIDKETGVLDDNSQSKTE